MNKSPLAGIGLTFIMGILAAEFTNIPFIIFWSSAFLAIVISLVTLKSNKKFISFFLLSVFLLGGAALRNSQNLPSNHISNFTPYKGTPVFIEGVVDSYPIVKTRVTSFILKTQGLINCSRGENIKVCGKVLVRVFGKRSFRYGDRLLIEGSLYRAPYFRISPRLNYRGYLKRKGIYSLLSVGKDSTIKLLDEDRGNPLKAFALSMKDHMKEKVETYMMPFSANVLNAIILGERSNLQDKLRNIMVQSGTIHIIAISGLHVGLVSFIILMILKIFRISKKLSFFIVINILIIYCVLTGARPSVIRVTIMAVTIFFGYIINRRINIYNALSLAAFLILTFNPQQLFDVSFQLSFMSIIAIVWLSPKIASLFRAPHLLVTLFSASLAAWIGLLPLIAYYFNIVSPIAILANMVVVPYLALVIGSGLAFISIGFICPPLASVFSTASEAMIIFLFKFISLSVRMPGAYFYLPKLPFLYVLFYYLAVGLSLMLVKQKN